MPDQDQSTGKSTTNWSEDLEEFHEESTRDHPIEVLTRRTVLSCLRLEALSSTATVVEVGCSTGYMLADLRNAFPKAGLLGVDLIASGLRKAHATLPECLVTQADACELPLADVCADGVVSINLLEHVPNDERALTEIGRVLRPGAAAVLVVPTGPALYDYYDRFLHHERRYGRGELAHKAMGVGLKVEADLYLGSVVYPAFWAIKKRNRIRFDDLTGTALEARVSLDYGQTKESRIFATACSLETFLLRNNVRLPFGIRGLTIARKPSDGS